MALFVLSLCPFDISVGVGGFCHRTGSDLLLFVFSVFVSCLSRKCPALTYFLIHCIYELLHLKQSTKDSICNVCCHRKLRWSTLCFNFSISWFCTDKTISIGLRVGTSDQMTRSNPRPRRSIRSNFQKFLSRRLHPTLVFREWQRNSGE